MSESCRPTVAVGRAEWGVRREERACHDAGLARETAVKALGPAGAGDAREGVIERVSP